MQEPSASSPAWKERAHQRSLAPARQRADDRLARLLRAALEMLNADEDVTVPALVARAGMSTKTFYRHFGSRDELLLAVLEEELAAGARVINRALTARSDPVDRLRVFINTYLRLPRGYATTDVRRARIQESQRLRAVNPERAAEAGALLHAALHGIVTDLADAGVVGEIDVELTTRSILHVLNGHLVDLAYASSSDAHENLGEHAVRVCSGMLGLPLVP
jgi:AcrR family transcriptional regulator